MKAITAALLLSLSAMALAQDFSPDEIAEYTAAAEQGNAAAQYNLGNIYERGLGVPEDDATAVKWYRKAAEQGDADAQYNLGVMYDKGLGVPQDYATALKWYTTAAEQGKAQAQSNLGVMYYNGEGVPEDKVMAYIWWNLAAAQGNEKAKENKDLLKEEMASSQIGEAQTLSRECLAKDYKNCG